MTENKANQHSPEKHSEGDKSKPHDKVLAGAQITKLEDNAVQQKAQTREALRSYKLTKDGQQSFSIKDEHGHDIKDTRQGKGDTGDKGAAKIVDNHDKDKALAQVEAATKKCLDEASVKYGHQNLHDIKIDKADLNAALTLSLLGPDAYRALGHDRAEAIGKSVIEHSSPGLHAVMKEVNPPVPENLAHIKSNPEDDKKLEKIGHDFLEGSKFCYGADQVAALHIDPKDWSANIGLFMVGPSIYKKMGHEAAQSLGKETLLFGVAPAFGVANEARKAMKDLSALGVEGSLDAMVGYGAGFLAKVLPETGIPMAIGGGVLAVKEQFSPQNQEHNRELFGINRTADTMTNSQLLAAANQTSELVGSGLFHGAVGVIAGGVGFHHGENAAVVAKEAMPPGGIKQAISDIAHPAKSDAVPGAVSDASRVPRESIGHQKVETPEKVENQNHKQPEKLEPVRVLTTPEKHATVDRTYPHFNYKIDGETIKMWDARSEGWAYGGVQAEQYPWRTFESPGMKLHVDVANSADLARVQKVLIPALEKDPELARMIPLWKTDPRTFVGEGFDQAKGQDAKGFTLYLKDVTESKYVMQKIDALLDKHDLILPRNHETGNVDVKFGLTNRVGLSRDDWSPSTVSPETPREVGMKTSGAELGPTLESKIQARYGEKLSGSQLRQIETDSGIKQNSLAYDENGKLMLRAVSKYSKPHGNGFYLSEAGSISDYGSMTDRPAMYALSKHFHVDQLDSYVADGQTTIRVALKPGQETTINQSIPALASKEQQQNIGLNPDSRIRVGRDATGSYVIDSHNAVVTKMTEPGKQGWVTHPPGSKVYVQEFQSVHLKNPNGPSLDLYSDKNFVTGRGVENTASPPHPVLSGQDTFDRIIFNGKQVSVNKPEVIIGRKTGDLLVNDNTYASSQHAALRIDKDGSFHIRDLGSTNGTWVNGRKLPGLGELNADKTLHPGDRVGFPSPENQYVFTGVKDAPLQRYMPENTLEYKLRPGEQNSVTDRVAIQQSKELQSQHELSTPLAKGYQDIPNNTVLNKEGQVVSGDPTTVFDPERDQRLQGLFKSAHTQLDILRMQNKEKELRTALAEIAHDSLTPKGRWSNDEIDVAYKRFANEHQGKQILLGEYLRQADQNIGGGVCAQQALLYKALCNEFGLDTKIVRGHVSEILNPVKPGAENFRPNHCWAVDVLGGHEAVFDPRAKTHGAFKSDINYYFDGKSIAPPPSSPWFARSETPAAPPLKEFSIPVDNEVIYKGEKWKFEGLDRDGNARLYENLTKTVTQDEFRALNPNANLTRSSDGSAQNFKIKRSGGAIDDDWQFYGVAKDGHGLVFHRRRETTVPTQSTNAAKDVNVAPKKLNPGR